MARCTFQYVSGDGESTERTIKDWIPSTLPDSIDAYCELRKEQRTFNLKRMVGLVDLETGEVVANPWVYFGTDQRAQTLDAATWQALPAIKAIKFFTLTTRGFCKRERDHLVRFIKEVCSVSIFPDTQLDDWLHDLWCANIYDYKAGQTEEYANLLLAIPANFMPRCQQCVFQIAKGSGRKEIPQFWLKRIEIEFSRNPRVVDPREAPDEDQF